jgi:peptide/nickel transport system ATP-binding protein
MPCDSRRVASVFEAEDLEVSRDAGFRVGLPALSLEPGASAVLLGPSGCGKTSLLQGAFRLLGAEFATTGRVRLLGEDFHALPPRERRRRLRERVAWVMQDAAAALDPLRTLGDQIAAATAASAAAIAAACERLGLGGGREFLRRHPHRISGGEAQRVLLVVALLRRPKLLVADEPTASLDGMRIGELADQLRELQRAHGTAVLLASHALDLPSALGSAVFEAQGAVFRPGRAAAVPWPAHPEPQPGPVVLSGRGLELWLGGRAVLAGVDLELRAGEIVAVVGGSGAGKTTLLRLFAGLRQPDAGTIRRPPRRTAVQLLFQDARASLTPGRTLRSLVRETCTPAFDLEWTAKSLGLPAKLLLATPASMSGGEQRRAALLRALSVEPAVLLLDEPTASLDRPSAVAVVEALLAVRRARGTALLLVTHDLELAARIAHRVLRLEGGRLCSAS